VAGEIKSRKWCRQSPFNCARHLPQSKTFLDAPAISICFINYCSSFPLAEVCLLLGGGSATASGEGYSEMLSGAKKRIKQRSPSPKAKVTSQKEVDVNAGRALGLHDLLSSVAGRSARVLQGPLLLAGSDLVALIFFVCLFRAGDGRWLLSHHPVQVKAFNTLKK